MIVVPVTAVAVPDDVSLQVGSLTTPPGGTDIVKLSVEFESVPETVPTLVTEPVGEDLMLREPEIAVPDCDRTQVMNPSCVSSESEPEYVPVIDWAAGVVATGVGAPGVGAVGVEPPHATPVKASSTNGAVTRKQAIAMISFPSG